jgi:hypothetical protein
MLKSNLTRNGVDLAFETNILYLDVTNARVGIGTSTPSTALHVIGTTTTNNLVVNNITSDDSTAIQINDAVNVSGLLTANAGLTINNNSNTWLFGSDGSTTLPAGGTITEGVVTSNPTIQLTPATPTVASQKLVIKGGGSYSFTTNGININYYVNTGTSGDTLIFYVYSDTYADQTLYWWIYPVGVGMTTPASGTVVLSGSGGNFSIGIDSDAYEFTVRVSPEANNYDFGSMGVESGLINADAPTFASENHLHLTTGNLTETSIFLGTDDHNVRTTTSGNIQITTPNTTNNVWEFGTNGSLTFPDSTIQNTAARITVVGDDSTGVILNAGETIKIAGAGGITTAVSGDVLTITGANQAQGITVVGDDSTGTRISDGETVKIAGTSNITTAVSGDTLTITGSKDIDINSISSTDSTAIQINDGINVNGTVTANSGLVANGITYPTTDGTTNQVLVTNGSGILSFTSLNSFAGITFVGDDSTGSTINTAETLKFTGSNNITTAVVNDTVTITGSKDIDVNSISSGDSSAIQINDAVNVSGTFHAATIVTNDLISEDSTAINVLDGLNVSGTLTANTAVINNINTADSSDIHINGAFVNFAGGGTVLYDEQATLNNLYDVEITNPQTDQFLRYNGAHWVNGQGATVSAGVGVGFWLTAPTISGVNANNDNPIASLSISPGTTTELTITKAINGITDIVAAFVSGALNRTVFDGGNWLFSNHVYVDSSNGTSTITDAIYTVLPFVTGTVTITGTGTSRTATASAGTPFATAAIDASATNTVASYLQTPQGLYQITARSSDTVVTITTPSGYTNESAVAGTVWKKWFVGNASAEINNTTVAQVDTDTTKGALPVTTDTRIGLIIFGTTTSNRTVSIVYDASLNATSFTTPLAAQHKDLAGLQGGQANEFYHLTSAEYTGTGTGAFVRAIGADLTNPHITGSLHVTTIDSTDSTTIEINSGVDVNGTLLAPTFITNNISSSDSTAIQIDDGLNVSGTLTANGTLNARTIVTNDISSGDSTAVQINDAVNVSGVITGGSNVVASQNLISNNSSGDEGGEILLAKPQTNSTIAGTGVTIDIWQNRLRFFEQGGSARGYFIDITNGGAGVSTLLSGGGGGSGTVTSITAGTGLTGGTITTTGTIALDFSTVVARIVGDDSTGTDLQVGETIKIAGTSNITTAVSGDTLTITGPDLSSYLTNSTLRVVGDDSTGVTLNSGETIKIAGAGGITTAVSGDTLTITGANQAQGITFFDDASTSTAIPDGGALQITSGEGISTSILGNVLTITNTSTQLEIDGGSAYSIYNAISEALIDGGSA